MKLTYLGTSAAEGFPAVFCNCEYCAEARRLKGKNIRTRSQALINDDLLIDLPADTYHHFLENDIEGDKIKYLLVTHSHSDHFYYNELEMRSGLFAHNIRGGKLEITCGRGVYDCIMEKGLYKDINVTMLSPFEKIILGNYTITALPARHMPGDEALIYLIEDDKTILYAHDTGYFYDEVFEYLKDNSIKLDMLSLDCTNVDIPIADSGTHMGLLNIEKLISKLKDYKNVNDKTQIYINHFSHNANPLHRSLEKRVEDMKLKVSYDGCEVFI